jgi:hypothetical protein
MMSAQLHMQWEQLVTMPGVKRSGRETDYTPSSVAEVKNGRAIIPLPIHLYGIVLN